MCLLLTLVLALSLCVIPAAAADSDRSDDPVVFVHGLLAGDSATRSSHHALLGHDHRHLPDYRHAGL
ncbi:MAG: hypothetical protein ACLTG4_04135 [Oscillospiraceae bacterium]